MTLKRSKNLNDADIRKIVSMLDGWTGSITWEAVIEGIERLLGQRYTRQALFNKERIRGAFNLRKQALSERRDVQPKRGSIEIQKLWERITVLEAENHRLENENSKLLKQFQVWLYNAHLAGLTPGQLNQPLPLVNRDPTLDGSPKPRCAAVKRKREKLGP